MINLNKIYVDVEMEFAVGYEFYRKFYIDFDVGERYNRNYIVLFYDGNFKFGIFIFYDNNGLMVKIIMKW